MNKYFKNITRPNLRNLTENELLEIIKEKDSDWCKNHDNHIRDKMVDKIFDLWAQEEIINSYNEKIECLICSDNLTNGNNLSFECGHKFHSLCIIKSTMIGSIDKYINFIKDNEKSFIDINYLCPQCNKIINTCSFDKNN